MKPKRGRPRKVKSETISMESAGNLANQIGYGQIGVQNPPDVAGQLTEIYQVVRGTPVQYQDLIRSAIISGLRSQVAKTKLVISELESSGPLSNLRGPIANAQSTTQEKPKAKRGRKPKVVTESKSGAGKGELTSAGRLAIQAAQKARWDRVRAERAKAERAKKSANKHKKPATKKAVKKVAKRSVKAAKPKSVQIAEVASAA